MSTDIILALITATSGLFGSTLGCIASSKLVNYRIEQLEKKVDSMATNEKRLSLLEQRIDQYERRKN